MSRTVGGYPLLGRIALDELENFLLTLGQVHPGAPCSFGLRTVLVEHMFGNCSGIGGWTQPIDGQTRPAPLAGQSLKRRPPTPRPLGPESAELRNVHIPRMGYHRESRAVIRDRLARLRGRLKPAVSLPLAGIVVLALGGVGLAPSPPGDGPQAPDHRERPPASPGRPPYVGRQLPRGERAAPERAVPVGGRLRPRRERHQGGQRGDGQGDPDAAPAGLLRRSRDRAERPCRIRERRAEGGEQPRARPRETRAM